MSEGRASSWNFAPRRASWFVKGRTLAILSGITLAVGGGLSCDDSPTGTAPPPPPPPPATVTDPDRAALTALYEATDGPNWVNSENWLTDAPLGDWYGVATDLSGRVVQLDLSGGWDGDAGRPISHGLSGPIPSELGGLVHLTWLSLGLNDLSGPIPPELGGLAGLTALNLGENDLSGSIPPELGGLVHLTWLSLVRNDLSGPVPSELSELGNLRSLFLRGTDVCVPGVGRFVRWIGAMESFEGSYCNESDATALESLHESAGGRDWINSADWLGGPALDEWHGVGTDSLGRVTTLDLAGNGLAGRLPSTLGTLSQLTELRVGDNDGLAGSLPYSLTGLPLSVLHYAGTDLCSPADDAFRVWLGGVPSHEGTDAECPLPPDWDVLAALYRATGGPNWVNSEYWLTDVPLEEWHGVETDPSGRVSALSLGSNGLSGPIPGELDRLANLTTLELNQNELSGPIPPELGRLDRLEILALFKNDLSGTLPPELGRLASLVELDVTNNTKILGVLPASLTDLQNLVVLQARGTGLCAPVDDASFRAWLDAVPDAQVAPCAAPVAYLVQTVQSREFPVPLVAGEEALLRVFVTAARGSDAGMPLVRARFHVNGAETHAVDIPATAVPIPTEIDEGDPSKSANAVIPGEFVRPGLEMVIEVDPDGTLDPALGVAERIPATGRLAVEVREISIFDLTVIPFLSASEPDSSVIGIVEGMAADPEGHELLRPTRTLLPMADISVTAHAPVTSSSSSLRAVLQETKAIRALEGGGHHLGLGAGFRDGPRGVAQVGGRSSASIPRADVIAHEFGHNMSLRHAPCGGAGGPDPRYPYPDGSIGVWGWDFPGQHDVRRDAGPVNPGVEDLMGYCGPPDWISDYHFTKALRYRFVKEGAPAAAVRSILVWGGVDVDGAPFLDPAFVVDAPVALPDSAGAYAVTGRDAGGGVLFSLSFAMPVLADAEGASSFVFAVPAEAAWEGQLASVTLSGPAGEVVLDGETNRPMAILRDPASGQVRGFFSELSQDVGTAAAAAAAIDAEPRLRVLFSRGIPDTAAWRR